jgi:hypothetical protein
MSAQTYFHGTRESMLDQIRQNGLVAVSDRRLRLARGPRAIKRGQRLALNLISYANNKHQGDILSGFYKRCRMRTGQLSQPGPICVYLTGLTSLAPGSGRPLAYAVLTSSGAAAKNSSAGI